MEPSNQKLIHTFGALADLGQEVANTGDFNDMVRTSMHLLLGTLGIAARSCRRMPVQPIHWVASLFGAWRSQRLRRLQICEEEKASLADTDAKAACCSRMDHQTDFLVAIAKRW